MKIDPTTPVRLVAFSRRHVTRLRSVIEQLRAAREERMRSFWAA